MKTSLIYGCIFMIVLSSGACSYKTRPDTAAMHDLGLLIKHSNEQFSALKVDVSAPEWLRDTRIHYRQLHINPTVVKFYNLDRWIAQPAALLAKHYSTISVNQSLSVKIHLMDFEQRFDGPKQARSVLSFEAEAYKPGERSPIARRVFHFEQVNNSADALGAVNSFAELTAESVISLSAWLNSLH